MHSYQEEYSTAQPIEVTWEEIHSQFNLIFENIQYSSFFHLLRIGKYNFFMKHRAKIELKGLVFALWRLALEHTFQEQGTHFSTQSLTHFLHNNIITNSVQKSYVFYWESLQAKKTTDFSMPAELVRSTLCMKNTTVHSIAIALYIRTLYQMIQDNLVDISQQ